MKPPTILRAAVTACLLSTSSSCLLGQAIIGGSQAGTTARSQTPGGPAPNSQPGALADISSAIASPLPLARWGAVALHPHFSYSFVYGDGLLRVPGQPTNTHMQTFSPGVRLDIGSYFTMDYTWTRTLYSTDFLSDTSDNNASIQASRAWRKLQVSASHSYGSNSPTLVETGTQTHEETHSSIIDVDYRVGNQSTLENQISRRMRNADPLIKSITWTGSDWVQWKLSTAFRYEISKKLNASVGIINGYDEISENPDMKYTQPKLEVSWHPTDKFSLHASGGIEKRKSVADGAKPDSNTVYDVAFRYSPIPTTSLSLTRTVGVSTSYFANSSTKSDGWSVNLHQRLLTKAFVTAGFSHGKVFYLRNSDLAPTNRDDKFSSAYFGIGVPVVQHGSMSLTYTESKNESRDASFAFTSHQISFQLTLQF